MQIEKINTFLVYESMHTHITKLHIVHEDWLQYTVNIVCHVSLYGLECSVQVLLWYFRVKVPHSCLIPLYQFYVCKLAQGNGISFPWLLNLFLLLILLNQSSKTTYLINVIVNFVDQLLNSIQTILTFSIFRFFTLYVMLVVLFLLCHTNIFCKCGRGQVICIYRRQTVKCT